MIAEKIRLLIESKAQEIPIKTISTKTNYPNAAYTLRSCGRNNRVEQFTAEGILLPIAHTHSRVHAGCPPAALSKP